MTRSGSYVLFIASLASHASSMIKTKTLKAANRNNLFVFFSKLLFVNTNSIKKDVMMIATKLSCRKSNNNMLTSYQPAILIRLSIFFSQVNNVHTSIWRELLCSILSLTGSLSTSIRSIQNMAYDQSYTYIRWFPNSSNLLVYRLEVIKLVGLQLWCSYSCHMQCLFP